MPTHRLVTIGTAEFTAECPVPAERVGIFEAIALALRGRWDAAANKDVPDTAATHTLHGIMSAHRRLEAEAVRRIDGALSALDLALAATCATVAEVLPEPAPIPNSAELQNLSQPDRAQWAARVRAARAAHAASSAARTRRDQATTRREQLLAARAALVVEGDDVRRQWSEAYAMRAARYTRARFARHGDGATDSPAVAAYRAVAGPTPERRGLTEGTTAADGVAETIGAQPSDRP